MSIKIAIYPTVIAALLFTIPQSIQLMTRPDSIYIPIVFEVLLFGVGFVAFGLINVVVVLPLWASLTTLTRKVSAGVIVSLLFAALVSFLCFGDDVMKAKIIFGAFIPLFSLSFLSYYFICTKDKVKNTELDE